MRVGCGGCRGSVLDVLRALSKLRFPGIWRAGGSRGAAAGHNESSSPPPLLASVGARSHGLLAFARG